MERASQRPTERTEGQHLVLYDGVCGLCNRLNQFVLPRDPRGVFNFASLQSTAGRAVLSRFGRDPDDLNTFYVVQDYRSQSPVLLSKSSAALFLLHELGAPWSWTRPLQVMPLSLLNRGYDLIASNRYRWFGRYESCLVPDAKFRNRFIDV
jgi:predicted DCC family thiol-disulfide oxidoreductase YuxK